MRVLIATHYLGIAGGVEAYLRALVPLLRTAGHEVGVLYEQPATAGTDTLLDQAADAPTIAVADRSLGEVIREVHRWSPDVVYAHGLVSGLLEGALANEFPTALFAHGYYGTCVGGRKCFTRPAEQPCRRRFGLGCLVAYPVRGCGGRSPLTMLREYVSARRRQRVIAAARAILVASHHMADEYRRHGVGDDRLRVVPLFPPNVEPDRDPPAPRPPSDRVLFVGRVTPNKGLRHLIAALPQAIARLGRPLTLVVAGDGPERPATEAAAKAARLPAEFLGWVGPDQRTTEMRLADVLAVPSVWPEPFGLVGLEAGCVGLPAVGYATGGIPDWLLPGESGELAPGDRPDPNELAAALVRALEDHAHRDRLAVGAHRVARRFTAERHLAELERVLADVAGGRSG